MRGASWIYLPAFLARDPFLASLPKEALEKLARSYDEVLAKYSTPALDVAQDGPHNQTKSDAATNAVAMEGSEANPEAVRQACVRQLFEARPSDQRTETGVLLFYGWLEQHHPELLPTGQGDPYQHLKVDLRGLYVADT